MPQEWKREAKERPPRVKKYAGRTKKGYRKRPRKKRAEKASVQLGLWRKKKPSKADRERIEAIAKERAKAPRPVMPDMSRKPKTPEYDTQMRLIPKYFRPIPKRVRPQIAGQRRRH